MNTVHPKIIAAALAVAPRNDGRPQLNGVRLHADKAGYLVVAGTDGSALLCIRTAIRWDLDPMTIPYDTAKSLAAAKHPLHIWANEDGRITTTAGGATYVIQPIDLPYPDYAVLIHDPRTDGPRNAIAPELIERFAKATKELTKVAGKCGVDVTEARNGCAAQWRVVPYNKADQPVLGAAFVVMPLRKDCAAEGLSFTALADGL